MGARAIKSAAQFHLEELPLNGGCPKVPKIDLPDYIYTLDTPQRAGDQQCGLYAAKTIVSSLAHKMDDDLVRDAMLEIAHHRGDATSAYYRNTIMSTLEVCGLVLAPIHDGPESTRDLSNVQAYLVADTSNGGSHYYAYVSAMVEENKYWWRVDSLMGKESRNAKYSAIGNGDDMRYELYIIVRVYHSVKSFNIFPLELAMN